MFKSTLTCVLAISSLAFITEPAYGDTEPTRRVRRVEQRGVRYLADNRNRQTLYNRMWQQRQDQELYDDNSYTPQQRRGYRYDYQEPQDNYEYDPQPQNQQRKDLQPLPEYYNRQERPEIS